MARVSLDRILSRSPRKKKEWYLLKPSIPGVIMEHFTANRPVLLPKKEGDGAVEGDDDEIVTQIKELLDTACGPCSARWRGYCLSWI